MTHAEALAMLQPVGIDPSGAWADLGAGSGRFTFALAELLGEGGVVHAVDREARGVENVQKGSATISFQRRDFTRPLGLTSLDGILMANSLHYVRRQERLLKQLRSTLVPGGKLVVIEYDLRRSNPWIPFPVPFERLEALYRQAGLSAPRKVYTRASRFGRTMYVVVSHFL